MSPTRRDFIRFVVAGSVAAGCPVDLSLLAADAPEALVDGEHNEICHKVRDGITFPKPPVSTTCDVIIAGGGVSGLSAAYFLRDFDFLLLEKEPHWGGNAYLEEFEGQAFATGSAFAEKGSDAEALSREIGLTLLPVNCPDPTIVNGKWIKDTWGGGLDSLPYPLAVRESFKKWRKDMLAINVSKNVAHYDSQTFASFLHGYAPELKQWWDAYGPSNWGARSEDTSALVGIQEIQWISDSVEKGDPRVTLPGGNGAISKKLAETLLTRHSQAMLGDSTVISVDPQDNGVNVTYLREGKPITAQAKYVIMATPKYITARIVSGMPASQIDAMEAIRYCPYPVVNMIFDKPVYNKAYDTWCPGNSFTDFVLADWVMKSQPGYVQRHNILSFYTPLIESERNRLLTINGCKEIAAHVLADFHKLLPEFDVEPAEIRFYRRGHPMFMPTPETFTKTIPAARRPLDRVFFSNTDSVGPESDVSNAISESRAGAEWVVKRLKGASAAAAGAALGIRG
ncbi:MAG TPA: FAD-dependent oxidoreductase [Verrucomicrobiae bacterium]|nr:FAD-dependent oxidoreductase [Verrucomicrobiae bacterium]